MDILKTILTILQIMLAFANVIIIGYALFKFLKKPQTTLEERMTKIEKRVEDLEDKERVRDERVIKVGGTNEILIHSVLALIEFEMQYCLIEHKEMSKSLEKAKEDLQTFLAKK